MLIVGYHRCWRIQGHVSGYFCWTFWWFLWVMLMTFIFAPRGRQDHVKLDNKSVEYTLPFTNRSQFFLLCFWLNSPEPNRKGRENKKSCLLNLFNWVKNILFTDQLRIWTSKLFQLIQLNSKNTHLFLHDDDLQQKQNIIFKGQLFFSWNHRLDIIILENRKFRIHEIFYYLNLGTNNNNHCNSFKKSNF